MIDFGVLYDKSPDMMIEEAYINALQSVDNGIEPQEIQAAWLGTLRGRFTGVTLAHPTGLFKIPVSRVENACATGNDAFRHACFAIAAGVYDTAIVIGYEKMNDVKGGLIRLAAIKDIWIRRARTMPSFFALRGTRHMHLYGSTKEDFALVSVKNRHNGSLYPHAHFRKEVTLEQVMNARIISWPLGLLDCCPSLRRWERIISRQLDARRRRIPSRLPRQQTGKQTGVQDGGPRTQGHRRGRDTRLLQRHRNPQLRGPRLLRKRPRTQTNPRRSNNPRRRKTHEPLRRPHIKRPPHRRNRSSTNRRDLRTTQRNRRENTSPLRRGRDHPQHRRGK